MLPTSDVLRRVAALAALGVGTMSGQAAAQHAHGAHGTGTHHSRSEMSGHAGLSLQLGTVSSSSGARRDYQSVALMAGGRWGPAELALHVPFYRIEVGSTWGEGAGDPHIEARWIALAGGAVEAGLSVAVMPPLGDDEAGLAMGHWMIMSGGFARVSRGRLSTSATLTYGEALGDGAEGHAHHHGGVTPAVAPMNPREIEASITPRVQLGRGVGLGAIVSGAAPLGDGQLIGAVDVMATVALGRFELGVGAGHGLFDHPSDLRGGTQIVASF